MELFWVLLGTILLASLVWYLLSRPRGIPPGPRGLPFVGNLHQLSSSSTYLDFMKIAKKYGDIFSLYMGTKLVIVLNSHKLMKEAFVSMGTTFADRPKAVVLIPETGGYFFTSPYTEKFLGEKKFAVMALRFAGYGTKSAEDRILTAVDDLSNFLMAKGPKPIALINPIKLTLGKLVCSILFSKEYSIDDPELENFVQKVNDVLSCFTSEVVIADAMPTWLAPIFFGKAIKKMKIMTKEIAEKFCLQRVMEHHSTLDKDNLMDFVDYYLAAGEKAPRYSDLELAQNSIGFFVDAVDTAAYLINWNIFYLVEYPEWQVQLQEEIDEVIGNSRGPSISDRAHLPKVEAFQQEVLRASSLFNISLAHKPLHDATLSGYHIPKNASILGNFWSANRDPEIWPEPAKFNPQRHIDKDGNFVKTDKIWIFGQGRRMCMGEQLVKHETYLICTRLLQRFTVKFPRDAPPPKMEDIEENAIRRPPPFKVCAVPR